MAVNEIPAPQIETERQRPGNLLRSKVVAIGMAAFMAAGMAGCDRDLAPKNSQPGSPTEAAGLPFTGQALHLEPLNPSVINRLVGSTVEVLVHVTDTGIKGNTCRGVHMSGGFIGTADHCLSIFETTEGETLNAGANAENLISSVLVARQGQVLPVSRIYPPLTEAAGHDVRLLKVDEPLVEGWPYMHGSVSAKDLKPGSTLYHISAAVPDPRGVVFRSRYQGQESGGSLLQFQTGIDEEPSHNKCERGDSGSPIANANSEVEALLVRRSIEGPSLCYGVAVDEVNKLFPDPAS